MNAVDYVMFGVISVAALAVVVGLCRKKKKTGSAFSCSGDCSRCDRCRK